MKKKQVIIFALIIGILLLFNSVLMHIFESMSDTKLETSRLINKEHIPSQKLFTKTWRIIKRDYYDSSLNNQNWERWKTHYKDKIKTDDDAKVAIDTMLASLDDPYSKFLTKEEFEEQKNSIDAKITGIGVNIYSQSGRITVFNVIEDTPAALAGLKADDVILTVDDKEVSGMQVPEVADIVRGEENTIVKLQILRDNKKLTKKIKRKEIKIKSIRSNVENDIGYIQISSFIGLTTSNEFLEAIEKTSKAKGLILDLRGNHGGLLPNAVFIANLFIPKGNIVSIVGRNGYKQNIMATNREVSIQKPVVVLIDGASASASEILSGALHDYDKAKLVGKKTYGKGMVQQIVTLPNETGINLTIAKYLTPLGTDINNKGIKPDIEVDLTLDDLKNNKDPQLDKAKSTIKEMIAQNN